MNLGNAVEQLNNAIQKIWLEEYPWDELSEAVTKLKIEKFEHNPPIQYPKVLISEESLLDWDTNGELSHHVGTKKEYSQGRLLLFIGLNPSTTSRGKNNVGKFSQGTQKEEMCFADLASNMKTDLEKHPYFKPIREFKASMPKYHIDLFAIHHTSQADLTSIILWAIQNKSDKLVGFFKRQVDAVHDFLQRVQPHQAILINSLTRDIFIGQGVAKGSNDYSPINRNLYRRSESWTTEPARLCNSAFSGYMHYASMLSGQRAMDVGSRERLEAVVARIAMNGSM